MICDTHARDRDFERTYELGRADVVRELERCVQGCDYGATSWTTRQEAESMAEHLALAPGTRLLDVGAGAGWPGLYLAQFSGCDVTLADVPLAGLRIANERANTDGLNARSRVVAADGSRLPFKNASFDAVSHSDVLCCMFRKLDLLRECRRVARTGARMEFSVIAIAPGLSSDDRQLAIDGGPPFVAAPEGYESLLARSGWRLIERIDVTAEYTRLVRILVDGTVKRAEALKAALGIEEFEERLSRRRAALAAIERGVLKREIFLSGAAAG